ncbi:MAG: hypothetical protein R3C68_08375 [Myxococcota bacterium]
MVTRGVLLGDYRYEYYKDKPKRKSVTKVLLYTPDKKQLPKLKQSMTRAQIVAEATSIARDLVNESPLQLYPETFAARAQSLGRKAGLTVKVLKHDQLKKLGMQLLIGVGAGSYACPVWST